MAKNLCAKIEPSDTLVIYDRNPEVTSKFAKEVGIAASSTSAGEKATNIEIAACVRDVAEKSVGITQTSLSSLNTVQFG